KEKITLKQVKSSGELIVYSEIADAEKIVAKLGLDFQLINKKEEDKVILPKPPLTTSLLLFEAKSQLGFAIAQTTQLAQKLYEGINLVSLGKQDAHEAIHPTYLDYHPDNEEIKTSLTVEEHQLYQLIFRHTLTNFMAPARIKKITYQFTNNDYYFSTNERVNKFFGFLAVGPEVYLASYRVKRRAKLGEISHLAAQKIEIQEYLENKPVRYNEGSLVQELERLGIGRPSTYNTFGRIIRERKYAELNVKGQFVPTDLEGELDRISRGENNYYHFIKNFWETFIQHFRKESSNKDSNISFSPFVKVIKIKLKVILAMTKGANVINFAVNELVNDAEFSFAIE
ncbi:10440_t:CDS:2, partial [Racocetra persica]